MTSGWVVAGRKGLWGTAGRVLVPLILAGGLALGLSRTMRARSQAAGASSRTCWARIDGHSADFETVQAAVDAAEDGDVIKVAGYCAGVEQKAGVTQTVYVSKSIMLRGGYTTTWEAPDWEANPTTLDAQAQGRVLYIVGNTSVTVEGLSITGGDAGDLAGGGVYAWNVTCTLKDNRIYANAADTGGGLHFLGSNFALVQNDVLTNSATDGGALSQDGASGLVVGSTFKGNHAGRRGGGLYVRRGAHLTVANSTIFSNTSGLNGGGFYLYNSDADVETSLIQGNWAADDGGGAYGYGTQDTRFDSCRFLGNVSGDNGGAIRLYQGRLSLVNTVLADNVSTEGSALFLDRSSSELYYATIGRNAASGLHLVGESDVALTNTILVGHSVGLHVADGSMAVLNATLWGSGAWANGVNATGGGLVQTGTHNFEGDPCFWDPDGGDYHIAGESAAIDRGLHAGIRSDIDGDPRPIGSAPDLGVDEVWLSYLPLVLRQTS